MTTSYYADRMNLFFLMQQHPDWSQQELAQAIGRSNSWVQKWHKRFADCSMSDPATLHKVAQGQSRARKTPPSHIDERIEALILELRDHPPEGLRRTPGPKTILYYLPRHVSAWDSERRLPTSTRTIYPRDAQRDHKEQKKQVFPQRKCVQTSRTQKHASTRRNTLDTYTFFVYSRMEPDGSV